MTETQITAASERVVNTIEQCMHEIALAAAVLRAVPDATPERVETLLRVGLAVERLEVSAKAAQPCRVEFFPSGRGCVVYGSNTVYADTLPEAVAAALGDVP